MRGLLFSHQETVPAAWTPLTKPVAHQFEPEIEQNELKYVATSRNLTSEITLGATLSIAAGDLVPYLALQQRLRSPLTSRLRGMNAPLAAFYT